MTPSDTPSWRWPLARGGALLLALWLVPPLAGQEVGGLPGYDPINPVAASRSGLAFQPVVPWRGGWHGAVGLDYGNMIELAIGPLATDTAFLLDAEVLRLGFRAIRDLDRRRFLLADLPLGGSYGGFLDGFLNWYHDLLGIPIPERKGRPNNSFAYQFRIPGGPSGGFRSSGLYLGDLRLGLGQRLGDEGQVFVSATLPTSTAPEGTKRGTVSLNALATYRTALTPRLVYEGSAGLGYTPRHGVLSDYQHTTFWLVTSGARYRFWGGQSLFANFFYHSSYYHDTGTRPLDDRDLTLDFGWIYHFRSGKELRVGMTEDPAPSGPAIDLDFRVGVGW